MASNLLGRTNQAFPPIWLSLTTPPAPFEDGWAERLSIAAVEQNTVVDISKNPALFAGPIRGTEAILMTKGGLEIEHATSDKHAADLIQAHLLESLSAIGREQIDFYFLKIRRNVEEFQIAGALEALEMGRQEGHIRFIGLSCEGPSLAVLGAWQFHDAFDVLLVPRNHHDATDYDTLSPLAETRRVGVVTSKPLDWGYGIPFTELPSQWRLRNLTRSFYGLTLAQAAIADLAQDHPVLVEVRSPEEIKKAIEAPTKPGPEGLDAFLEPYRQAWDDDAEWAAIAQSDDPVLQKGASLRSAG